MNESKIRITQYEQAADEKVSLGGIKWERKWDVCIQCDSREEAERVRAALTAQPEQQRPPNCGTSYCSCIECVMAQPEQEPVAWQWLTTAHFRKRLSKDAEPGAWNPLYTTPPRREWVGLTEEDMVMCESEEDVRFARAIEAKLKEKNA